MKLSKDFLWGIGAGLILSALLLLGINAVLNQDNNAPPANGNDRQNIVQNEDSDSESGESITNSGNAETEENGEKNTNERNTEAGNPNVEEQANPANQEEQSRPEEAVEGSINTEEVVVTIPYGSTSEDICRLLEINGVIRDKEAFNNYIREQNKSTKLLSGTFVFPAGLTKDEILDIITMK